MSAPLPPGWKALSAPDGRPYYFNPQTGVTSWSLPFGTGSAHVSTPSAPPYSPSSSLNGGKVPASLPLYPSNTVPLSGASPDKNAKDKIPYVATVSSEKYTLESLLKKTGQRDMGNGFFELARDKLLEINLTDANPWAWIKHGSMVARRGNIKFTRQSARQQGFSNVLKKALTGEGMTLVKCEGTGKVFVADCGKIVSVVQLNNQSLSINGNDVLAMSGTLNHEIKLIRSAGMASGGLFNVRISGTGMLAFTCHGSVVTLSAKANDPVYTDPNATVAWTHEPSFTWDLSLKSMLGRTTGEEFQLCFKQGYVVIQPYEELSPYAEQQ